MLNSNLEIQNKQIKRVAAIHDLCGYGKCSLGIAIPVISSAGIEVCSVPTGIFSMHTALENWTMLDTTDILEDYIRSWKRQNFHIDAVYSGFLSNKKQIFTILQLYNDYPNAIKLLDPVMGENGTIYKTYTEELCNSFSKLVGYADILTPNYTEACILTNKEYSKNPTFEDINQVLLKLNKMGAKKIVLTGVIVENSVINYVFEDGIIKKITSEYIDMQSHGAGDLFSSCLISAYLNNNNFFDSCLFASDFVYNAVKFSTNQKEFKNKGVNFEPLLYKMCELNKSR